MYIGKTLSDGQPYSIKPSSLTTHGLCVGMTGSGKTGLCIALLEELRRAGVPSIVIDPKGDMGNLALAFPALDTASFAPWIDPAEAQKAGQTTDEMAAAMAQRWREGLANDQLTPDDIRAMDATCPVTIFTPGSTAGQPLNLLAGLAAPEDDDPETRSELIKAAVGSLLGLVGIQSDPLTGREFILLANVLDYCWEHDEEATLERLIAYVQNPPIKRLGVFAVDSFFPAGDRLKLALALNGLMASPTFRLWREGTPLSIAALLRTSDGRPQTSVLYLAHLTETERLFVIGLVTARLVSWMRRQPGTGELRALLYLDEVFGLMPPHPQNPPTKGPLLTLFKQARAFGVGVVAATQNPMDVDYKVFANAGLWLVGRLATDNDRRRIVDGLRGAAQVPDDLAGTLASLDKRQFFVRSLKGDNAVIRSRFAMSFLRGPLTKADIQRLSPTVVTDTPAAPPTTEPEGLLQAPVIAGVRQLFLDPSALREPELTAVFGPAPATGHTTPLYRPAFFAACQARFDDTKARVVYDETVGRVVFPLPDNPPLPPFADAAPLPDLRAFVAEAPAPGARFAPLPSYLDEPAEFDAAARSLADYLYRARALPLFHNPGVKLYSRPGETEADFAERCRVAADEEAKKKIETEQAKAARRLERLERQRLRLEGRVDDAQQDAKSREMESMAGMLETAAGFLFGRRRSIGRAVSGTMSKRRMTARAKLRGDRYEDELNALAEEIQVLQDEIEAIEDNLATEFAALAEQIEPYPVNAERNDVRVVETAVLWVPGW